MISHVLAFYLLTRGELKALWTAAGEAAAS
jgi:hypothetical protein